MAFYLESIIPGKVGSEKTFDLRDSFSAVPFNKIAIVVSQLAINYFNSELTGNWLRGKGCAGVRDLMSAFHFDTVEIKILKHSRSNGSRDCETMGILGYYSTTTGMTIRSHARRITEINNYTGREGRTVGMCNCYGEAGVGATSLVIATSRSEAISAKNANSGHSDFVIDPYSIIKYSIIDYFGFGFRLTGNERYFFFLLVAIRTTLFFGTTK